MSSTPDHDHRRRRLRQWLAANVPAHFLSDSASYREPAQAELVAWERKLHDAGLAGAFWPKDYGGHGLDMQAHLIASQELGRLALPESVNSIGKEIISAILMGLGTEAQKRRFLPAMLRMDDIWCQGFSEPNAGSDLAAVETRAVRNGDGWRINGAKIWTSFARTAQRCLLLARTGEPGHRYRNLSLFIVHMDAPGIDIRPIQQVDGSSEFNEVFFDNVQVGADDVVGQVDRGWQGAVAVLTAERATNRMYRGWRFENELKHFVRVCREDQRLRPLLHESATRRELARTATDIRIVQRYAEEIARRVVAGAPLDQLGSQMKLHWSAAHQRFAGFAQGVLGTAAADESPERTRARHRFRNIYLRARSESLIAGSSEVQLSIIADRVLGLPKQGAAA